MSVSVLQKIVATVAASGIVTATFAAPVTIGSNIILVGMVGGVDGTVGIGGFSDSLGNVYNNALWSDGLTNSTGAVAPVTIAGTCTVSFASGLGLLPLTIMGYELATTNDFVFGGTKSTVHGAPTTLYPTGVSAGFVAGDWFIVSAARDEENSGTSFTATVGYTVDTMINNPEPSTFVFAHEIFNGFAGGTFTNTFTGSVIRTTTTSAILAAFDASGAPTPPPPPPLGPTGVIGILDPKILPKIQLPFTMRCRQRGTL